MQESGAREARRAAMFDTGIVVVAALARFLLDLDAEAFRNWDEGLYCAASRDMLVEGNPLFAVEDGAFDSYYGKPPLINWLHFATTAVFGFTPFALRLPSAAASLLSVILAHRVASRLGGRGAGAFVAAMLLVSLPFADLGRQNLLEPLLGLFALASLHLHGVAIERRSVRHALFAGVVVGLSVLTKQLVGALPFCAVVVAELALRRPGAVRRLLAHGGALLVSAGWWFVWVRSIVGPELEESFVHTHLLMRAVGAFEMHGRMPADYGQHLSLFFWTVPIVAGAIGAISAMSARETRAHGLLLGAFAFGHYLLFGVLSRNFLPWYVFSVVPSVAVLAAMLFAKKSSFWLRALLLGSVGAGVALDAGADPVAFGLVGVALAVPFEWRPIPDRAPTFLLLVAFATAAVLVPVRVVRELPEQLVASIPAEEALVVLESPKQFVWKCYLPGAEFAATGRSCPDVLRRVAASERDIVITAPGIDRCELHTIGFVRTEAHEGYVVHRRVARGVQAQ